MNSVRKALPSDLAKILELGSDIQEFSVAEETVDFWPEAVLRDALVSSDVVILVATNNMAITGFIIASLSKSLRKATIENIFVSSSMRNQGIGAQLVSNLLDILQTHGIEYVATLVPPSAHGAQALYTNAGFTKGELFLWLDKPLSAAFQ
jgi:ribosomal protein S18 acetylase RimI-like enzyme